MVLRSSEYLVEFLREANVEQFVLKALGAQQAEGPRRIADMATLGGDIDVHARKTATSFCDNFGTYINTYSEINSFIAERCKTIQGKAHDLADEYFAVASEIQRFSVLLRATDIPQIQQLYERLSQLVTRNGDFVLQSGELFNNQLNSWFKFHREESVALREAQSLQNISKMKADQRYASLMKQKEKLFLKML